MDENKLVVAKAAVLAGSKITARIASLGSWFARKEAAHF
jgi:hypothetical protein